MMKFFVTIALIATVASGSVIPSNSNAASVIEHILEAIAALKPESIAVGPAIVDTVPEPVSVGPAVVDFPVYEPVSVGPAWIESGVVSPSPVSIIDGAVADVSTSATPLVQIILNINQAAGAVNPAPVVVGPAVNPAPVTPVQVVDTAPVPVTPVQVVEVAPVPVEPVQVVEVAPIAVEPVIIGTPIIPAPAVILPEELN